MLVYNNLLFTMHSMNIKVKSNLLNMFTFSAKSH